VAARIEAELLLCHVLGTTRARLPLRLALTGGERRDFERLVDERATTGRPVAYTVGRRDFHELELFVDERVMVPRPETETVVEVFLDLLERGLLPAGPVVDRGTGSGCLALCAARHRPTLAIELSAGALQVASLNRERWGEGRRVTLVQGDGLGCLREGSVAAVLANPPYVEREALAELPEDVRRHEPIEALVPEGVSVRAMFEGLLDEARRVLEPGGWLVTEVGAGQAPWVASLASVSGYRWTTITPDLAGIDRVVAAQRA
jgi:release factor glutamine methyltransferase